MLLRFCTAFRVSGKLPCDKPFAPNSAFVILSSKIDQGRATREFTFPLSRPHAHAQTAVQALGAIHTDYETFLPPLTNALTSPHLDTRVAAPYAIRKFGTNATSALPALMNALNDPSPRVRSAASNAVARIAPDAFAPPNRSGPPN